MANIHSWMLIFNDLTYLLSKLRKLNLEEEIGEQKSMSLFRVTFLQMRDEPFVHIQAQVRHA